MKGVFLLISFGICCASQGYGQATRPVQRPAAQVAEVRQAPYAQLDDFARQLPETQATTLDKLAAALAAHAHTEQERAWLIFAWIAYHVAYDIAGVRAGGRCT
jgi:hypothetical protein